MVINMNNKIWALFVNLSFNMWKTHYDGIVWDEELWKHILKTSSDSGINTIVLDVGDGVKYSRHPEISLPDAWDRKRISEEIKRCEDSGIKLIPKLNFSTTHSLWLGDYHRMTSSSVYYKVVKELIEELYEMFQAPKYIHIGMDEENGKFASAYDYVVYRQEELLINDISYICDAVKTLGATPWMWIDPLFNHTDKFSKCIPPEDVVLSPWYYLCFRKEHYTPVESLDNYRETEHYKNGYKYLEDIPEKVEFRQKVLPLMDKGYRYIPCGSNWWHTGRNMHDLVEYFKNGTPNDEQILGYMTAPWKETQMSEKDEFDEAIAELKFAKDKFYK